MATMGSTACIMKTVVMISAFGAASAAFLESAEEAPGGTASDEILVRWAQTVF